ncbi:MOSC domain-containing protein [Engelhardtia mirabilis]|uniref:MOSC domain-containing protein n=1 Tax=Engelhardtia mirabilis TaxID=2528011 RepID=UPI003AF3B03A
MRGCEAYAEDHWRRLRIGDAELEVVKPASRCVLVNVNPTSGERDRRGEPLRTLAGYRRTAGGNYAHKPDRIYLGVRASVARPGRVQRGDMLEILD